MESKECFWLVEWESCPWCWYWRIVWWVCDNPSCWYWEANEEIPKVKKSVDTILLNEKITVKDYLKNREFLFFPNLSNISENEFLIEWEFKWQKFSIKWTYSIRIINNFHSSEQEERAEKKIIDNIIITKNSSLDHTLASEIVFRILDDYRLNKHKI